MRKTRTAASLIVLAMAAQVLAVGAQDKPKQDQGTIKLATELVQIDVLVNDKDNKPVAGLKREDFELYDNNKLQRITSFSFEETRTRRMGDVATTVHAKALPRAITAGELNRVMAFVVDTLHIKFGNLNRTRKILKDFVDNKMQPGDLVLILPTGGGSGILQQFTSDRRLLHRAIDRLRPLYFTNAVVPYRSLERRSPALNTAGDGRFSGPEGGLRMPDAGVGASGNVDPLEEADIRTSLGALNETVKYMASFPGRKVSVFVSEGFRLYQTRTEPDLLNTTALAARANVVFYTIDPRGLETLTLDAGDDVAANENNPVTFAVVGATNQKRSDFFESQDSLNVIASNTGGKFYRNNNDIQRGLDVVLEENAAYYMLGFYPEAGKWDGKYHKVKVVVRGRPDLTVSFRKGYLAKTPPPENVGVDPKTAEALEAISSPLVRRDIDIRLTPLYIDNVRLEPVVTLLLHIDASKLSFTQTEGRHQAKLEQIGFVIDASGRIVDKFTNVLDLNLQPETYQSALKRGFVATRTINVKPGTYQVRLFLREEASGLIGTANDFIEIPDMKADRLSTSSLFLTGQAIEQGKVVDTAGLGGTPSQRRFQRKGDFSYSMVIYNAKVDGKKQPQLEMRTRILRGNQVVFSGEPRPVTPGEGSAPPVRVITGGVIKLLQLTPDDYTIQVTVTDKLRKTDNVVRTEIGFSVE